MLCSKSSSYRDFLSASDFGLNLAFAACCQPSVPCDPRDLRALAGLQLVASLSFQQRRQAGLGLAAVVLGRAPKFRSLDIQVGGRLQSRDI